MKISIKLKIDGVEKEISLEEAKELWEELDALFGEKEIITYPIPCPYPTPIYVERWDIPYQPTISQPYTIIT
jgi:hypothetical protein